jgi:hypothetical protein
MLRKLMPIKPADRDAQPSGRWGSTYEPKRGQWEPDQNRESPTNTTSGAHHGRHDN